MASNKTNKGDITESVEMETTETAEQEQEQTIHQASKEIPSSSKQSEACTEVLMARELLSAATETFKMAQHIRKLEHEIHKLKKKMKKRHSSDESSTDEDGDDKSGSSSDSDDSLYNQKRKSKRKRKVRRSLKGKQEILETEKSKLKKLQQVSHPSQQISQPLQEVSLPAIGEDTICVETTQAPSSMSEIESASSSGTAKKKVVQVYLCEFCGRPFGESEKPTMKTHIALCAKAKGLTPKSALGIATRMRLVQFPPQRAKSSAASPMSASEVKGENLLPKTPTVTTEAFDNELSSQLEHRDELSSQLALHKTQIKALSKSRDQPRAHTVLKKESKYHKETRDLEMMCPDCGLRLAKVAQAHHSRMCKRKPVCLYCAKIFPTISALQRHKPDCKKANWQDHPIRLLQHELYVPDSRLNWVTVSDNTSASKRVKLGTVKTEQNTQEDGGTAQRGMIFHLCMTCDKHFSSVEQLRAHKEHPDECHMFMQQKKRPGGLKQSQRFCYVCMQSFANQQLYINHKSTCDTRHIAEKERHMFNCFICYKGFSTSEELRQHKKLWHINAVDTSNCWVCGQMFSSFKEMLKHHNEAHKQDVTGVTRRPRVASAHPHLVLKTGVDELTSVDTATEEMVNETIKTIDFTSLMGDINSQILNTNTKQTTTKKLSKNANADRSLSNTQKPNSKTHRMNVESVRAVGVDSVSSRDLERSHVDLESVPHDSSDQDMTSTVIRVRKRIASPADLSPIKNAVVNTGLREDSATNEHNSTDAALNVTAVESVGESSPNVKIIMQKNVKTNTPVNELFSCVKDGGGTGGNAFQDALSKLGINSPVRVISGNGNMVLNVKDLANAKQVQLPGNKKGYVFTVGGSTSNRNLPVTSAATATPPSRLLSSPRLKSSVSTVNMSEAKSMDTSCTASSSNATVNQANQANMDTSCTASSNNTTVNQPNQANIYADKKNTSNDTRDEPQQSYDVTSYTFVAKPKRRRKSAKSSAEKCQIASDPKSKQTQRRSLEASTETNVTQVADKADTQRLNVSNSSPTEQPNAIEYKVNIRDFTDSNQKVKITKSKVDSLRNNEFTNVKTRKGKASDKTPALHSVVGKTQLMSPERTTELPEHTTVFVQPKERSSLDHSLLSNQEITKQMNSEQEKSKQRTCSKLESANAVGGNSKPESANVGGAKIEKSSSKVQPVSLSTRADDTSTQGRKRNTEGHESPSRSRRERNKPRPGSAKMTRTRAKPETTQLMSPERTTESPERTTEFPELTTESTERTTESPVRPKMTRTRAKPGARNTTLSEANQPSIVQNELFSSTLNSVEKMDNKSTSSARRKRKHRTPDSGVNKAAKVSAQSARVEQSSGDVKSPVHSGRRTITSGGIEMLVSVADDKITCSRCKLVMSSIAEIAKHKCYTTTCYTTTPVKSKPQPRAKVEVFENNGNMSQEHLCGTSRSPQLRSYSTRGYQSRSRPFEPQARPRGVDLGPELVDVIDAELSDDCNVDIVGDTDDL